MQNAKARKFLFPNLDKIINNGVLCRATSNAQCTQFVMPSIFCQSYPLDYNGYNDGILHRPCSYIELINKEGYETQLLSSCNQLGLSYGYNRGFDRMKTTIDYRVVLEQRISRNLSYYISQLKIENSESDKYKEITKELFSDYKKLLTGFIESVEKTDASIWGKRLRHYNYQIIKNAKDEINLINSNKDIVLKHLDVVPPGIYWYILGRKKIPWFSYTILRLKEGILWRLRRITSSPFVIYSHWVSYAKEVFSELLLELETSKIKRQHFHVHIMDVHDCRALNRPLEKISRLVRLPRWIYARVTGLTDRSLMYDLALMSVDRQLGYLMKSINKQNLDNKTAIVISGDHGSFFAGSPRKYQQVNLRTHYEDVTIPIVAYNCNRQIDAISDGMNDSMSITATLLDFMCIKPDASFLGNSITKTDPNDCVIVESVGFRLLDESQPDLFFTLVNKLYRVMIVVKDSQLFVRGLYNYVNDPQELINLSKDATLTVIIKEFICILFNKRSNILSRRDVEQESWRHLDKYEAE
jgi:hypothetical protein